ncbi:MAG: hypothetical protein KDM64_18965, partial [Verrucomicrobiae bacterium]|nr:hypothetical protein [Verrucomicrobiae bacterium]
CLLGLMAGMGAAAFFWKDLQTQVWPKLQPILQKVMPGKKVVEESASVAPQPAAPAPPAVVKPLPIDEPVAIPRPASSLGGEAKEPTSMPTQFSPPKPAFDTKPLRIQDTPSSSPDDVE